MTIQELHDEYVHKTDMLFLKLQQDVRQAFTRFDRRTKKALREYNEKIQAENNSRKVVLK